MSASWLTRLTGLFHPFRGAWSAAPDLTYYIDEEFPYANGAIPSPWVDDYPAAPTAVSAGRAVSAGGFASRAATTIVGRAGIVFAAGSSYGGAVVLRRVSASRMVVVDISSAGRVRAYNWLGGSSAGMTTLGTVAAPTAGTFLEAAIDADQNLAAYVDGVQVGSAIPWVHAETDIGLGVGFSVNSGCAIERFVWRPTGLELTVGGVTIDDGRSDPVGLIVRGADNSRTYTIVNRTGLTRTVGATTAGALAITDDPTGKSLAHLASVEFSVAADSSDLGQVTETVEVAGPVGTSLIYRAAVVRTADLSGLIYSIGNSYTNDAINGGGAGDNPFGAGGPAGNHLRPGASPAGLLAAPYASGTTSKPAPWPVALRGADYVWLSVQPYGSGNAAAQAAAIEAFWVYQPDASLLLHDSWISQSGWAAGYAANRAMLAGTKALLVAAHPDRVIRSTRMDEMLHYARNDPSAPAGAMLVYTDPGFDRRRSVIGTPEGFPGDDTHTETPAGYWLDNNSFRAPMGRPLVTTDPGVDADIIAYWLGVLLLFHPDAVVSYPVPDVGYRSARSLPQWASRRSLPEWASA